MKDIKKELLDEIKLNIAISEFRKEYEMKSSKKNNKLTLQKVAIIILSIGILLIGGVQAKKLVQSFTNRKPVYIVNSISEAITDGYVENLGMEYAYSDNIGLKINSFLMSENDINIVFDFKVNDNIDLNDKELDFAYILYNEDNVIYRAQEGTNINLIKEFIKKNKIEVNDDIEPHFMTGQNTYITKTSDNIIMSSLISAKDYFPKAKKLYIKVVGIGYKDKTGKYKALSNSEWNIELDVPEKFYLDTVIKYKLKELKKGINIERMMVSNTSMTFTGTIENFNSGLKGNNKISIIDENEKEYTSSPIYFDSTNKDKLTCQFPISKNKLTNKMYLKTSINGVENVIELVKF